MKTIPPIEQQTKPLLTTEEAAFYLNLKPQTLRCWSIEVPKPGPIKPIRIGNRLGWRTKELKALLFGDESES